MLMHQDSPCLSNYEGSGKDNSSLRIQTSTLQCLMFKAIMLNKAKLVNAAESA